MRLPNQKFFVNAEENQFIIYHDTIIIYDDKRQMYHPENKEDWTIMQDNHSKILLNCVCDIWHIII